MSDLIKSLETYDDLVGFLSEWRSAEDPDVYDFGGIVGLWLACQNNIEKFGVEGELEDLGAYLEDSQKSFLRKVCNLVEGFSDLD